MNRVYRVRRVRIGFKRKGACLLGYNIIVAPNRRYGLKRRSGTFGSISDLNVGSVQ